MKRNDVVHRPRRAMRVLLRCFMSLAMMWSLFPAGVLADQRDDVVEIPLIGKENVRAVDSLKGGEGTENADAPRDAEGGRAVNLGNDGDDSDGEEVQLLAQWTAHSRSEALAWVNSQNGKALDFDGYYGPQCVDFTCFYYQYLGQAIPWGNANQYANGGNFCPAGWSYQGSPQPGDIAVWTSKAYDPSVGHVGVVTEVNGSQMVCMEQNSDGWGAPCRLISHGIYAANTYIRPDWPSEHPIPGPILNRPNVNVDSGDFVIRSAIGNRVLTIGGGSKGENGANAQLWTGNAFDNSVFRIEWSGDGYRIALKSSGKVLDTYGYPWTATVANVRQWDDLNEPEQRWLFQDAGDGWVYIRNLNGYYLDVEGGWQSNRDGGNVQTWDANESEAQKWKLERQIPGDILPNANVDFPAGNYMIRSAIGNRVLDIDGSKIDENGANAQIWECNGSSNQVFHIAWNGDGYRINPKSSGKVLEVSGNADVATLGNVQQWQDNNDTDQRWLFQDAGDGWVYIRNLNGFYLDVEGGWSANRNGGNVHTWVTNSTEAQRWKLERVVRSLSEAAVSVSKSLVYTGSRLAPTPTVKLGGAALVKGTDYDVSYKNNVNVGTATVTITGKGDYTGTKSATFKIAIPFADVTMKTGHAGDIGWLYETKISQGWALPSGDREYRPLANVARADMAAFLFRLAIRWGMAKDSWKPADASSFLDVDASTAHYREIMWLAEGEISVGWNNGDGTKSFRPYANVARADMAAFLARLYRLRGKATTGSKGFLDVDDGTAHSEDIRWLAACGVSKGWDVAGGSEFRPYANVARADMAAFLHRLDGLK